MRRFSKLLAWGVLMSVSVVGFCNWLVRSNVRGLAASEIASVPSGIKTALVLGCSKKLPNGRENRFFVQRIIAAADLYQAGKCSALIVSGDNSVTGYDEPTDMKDALVAAGVPEDRIHCDYAGFRTLDSVVRARKIFGQSRILIVSQRTHTERALYLAHAHGLDAFGFQAPEPVLSDTLRWKNQAREFLARVQAVLDVWILRTQPKFLGPPVLIP